MALRLTMGAVNAGPASNLSSAAAVPKLDNLTRFDQLQRGDEIDPRFQKLWQDNTNATKTAFEKQAEQIGDLATIVARLEANERLTQEAKATADAADARESLANSYTNPVSVLTASGDGTVTVAAHQRIYGNSDPANLSAGSVTGFAAGDYVSVYYSDAARDGVGITYQGTASPIAQADPTHVIGQITIPQAGDPPATGGGGGAPGYTPPPDGGGDYP